MKKIDLAALKNIQKENIGNVVNWIFVGAGIVSAIDIVSKIVAKKVVNEIEGVELDVYEVLPDEEAVEVKEDK